jgi:hypothetical protein
MYRQDGYESSTTSGDGFMARQIEYLRLSTQLIKRACSLASCSKFVGAEKDDVALSALEDSSVAKVVELSASLSEFNRSWPADLFQNEGAPEKLLSPNTYLGGIADPITFSASLVAASSTLVATIIGQWSSHALAEVKRVSGMCVKVFPESLFLEKGKPTIDALLRESGDEVESLGDAAISLKRTLESFKLLNSGKSALIEVTLMNHLKNVIDDATETVAYTWAAYVVTVKVPGIKDQVTRTALLGALSTDLKSKGITTPQAWKPIFKNIAAGLPITAPDVAADVEDGASLR